MPTPVTVARQCLTEEAARALDDAVSVARRRGHAQTSSLHAVSALLALPSSILREACARARSTAYSPRLQFRALELSVCDSLDRLPSSKTLDDPPISNSLMAAIKRSQANQRRQPENFHMHQIIQQQQQQQQQQNMNSLFKVELKHMILSILDDPIVSRVFGEAGFRSYDIKYSILHPPVIVPLSLSAKTRRPPIFLCNLSDSELGQKGLSLPYIGGEDGDENCKIIGKILVKKTSKNPLLIGVCANDALNCFTDCVRKGKGCGILPFEINGLNIESLKNEVTEFVINGGNKAKVDMKVKELGEMIKNGSGPGIVVSFGDLKVLVDDGLDWDNFSYLVSQFTALLEVYRDKLWLIGAAGNYETYLKLLARFPSLEKDLDLQLLPITSSRPSIPHLSSKSSLIGSFVPFGGFFSTSSDFNVSLSSNIESRPRCGLCTKKCEEEVSTLKRGSKVSVADQCSSTLPSWLQMTELDASKGGGTGKDKDDGAIFNAKIVMLQKKWDDICQNLHSQSPKPPDILHPRTHFLSTEGSQFAADKKENNSSKGSSASENKSANEYPCIPTSSHSPQKQNAQQTVSSLSKGENGDFPFKLPLESQVRTDLVLGTVYASTSQDPKTSKFQFQKECLQNFSSSMSTNFDVANENITNHIVKPSSCSASDFKRLLDPRDFKSLCSALLDKVGRQNEAISLISHTVSSYKAGNGKRCGSLRGDIWLSFLGPDKSGKKRIASALAEVIFGSRESLISIDLSYQDGMSQSNTILNSQELNDYDLKFRGKTVVDYITEELRRRPHSIVFLENVDKADPLAQSSLSRAVKTGKFPDSQGREIGINNTIFVTTSSMAGENQNFIPQKESLRFSEEEILAAKRWQMQILIGKFVAGDSTKRQGNVLFVMPPKQNSSVTHLKRRRLGDTNDEKVSRSYLDLNLPLNEMEDDIELENSDNDSISENSEAWLDDFFNQVDERIILKPFDFDSLCEQIMKRIRIHFQKVFGSSSLLEIDNTVMGQILAAAWLSDDKNAVNDWLEQVLSTTFAEVRERLCPTDQSLVKLVACDGILMEGQTRGICLPSRIIVN